MPSERALVPKAMGSVLTKGLSAGTEAMRRPLAMAPAPMAMELVPSASEKEPMARVFRTGIGSIAIGQHRDRSPRWCRNGWIVLRW